MRSPVNRHRIWQLAADGALIATAWLLAFQLRFDSYGKIPPFYEKLVSWRTVLLVVAIKLVVFTGTCASRARSTTFWRTSPEADGIAISNSSGLLSLKMCGNSSLVPSTRTPCRRRFFLRGSSSTTPIGV